MKVLVFNCGSSSIKYQLFFMPSEEVLAKGSVTRIGEDVSEAIQKSGNKKIEIKEAIGNHEEAIAIIERMLTDSQNGAIDSMKEITACGHRIVHGGEEFKESINVTEEVEQAIEKYASLAPLHNPPNLVGIRAARKMLGDIPQIACFDTAFHQSIPQKAYMYGLPYTMYENDKIRKYGFHGTSHKYVARQASEILKKDVNNTSVITCHLGNGCSITAIKDGKSVDTSMGLTPLEGVVMGTRTGDLDPAIIFHLIRNNYTSQELDTIFNKKSGLLGISEISNDVRDLEEKSKENFKAKLALDIFAYRVKKYIGSYLAVLNGCDAIVFTGGIGENESTMRKRIISDMETLGIKLSNSKNENLTYDNADISTDDSKIKILVIPTNEEGEIARDTYNIASKI